MFCLDVHSGGYHCDVDSGGLMRNKNSDTAGRRTKLELLHPQTHAVSPAVVAKIHKRSQDQLALIRCKSLTASRLRQHSRKPLCDVLIFYSLT